MCDPRPKVQPSETIEHTGSDFDYIPMRCAIPQRITRIALSLMVSQLTWSRSTASAILEHGPRLSRTFLTRHVEDNGREWLPAVGRNDRLQRRPSTASQDHSPPVSS